MTNYTQWKSLVDLQEYSAIPDSAILHWPINEGSGDTIYESIGEIPEQDGDIQGGIDWIDNNWWGGWALDSPGESSDDTVATGQWGDWGSGLDTGGSIMFTFESTSTGKESFISCDDADENMFLIRSRGREGDADDINFWINDNDDNRIEVETEAGFMDGEPHRCVINIKGENASDPIDIWIDGDLQNLDYEVYDGNLGNVENVSGTVYFFWGNDDPKDSILDNVIVTDEPLTDDEIEDDYESQPWV